EATLDRTTVSGNSAVFSAGLFSSGVVTINKSTFVGNFSLDGHGAVSNTGQMYIVNSTVDHNDANGPAGGLLNSGGGTMTIFRSRITRNGAISGAGGLEVTGGSVRISETTFEGNGADGTAALAVSQGTVLVTESAFVENGSECCGILFVAAAGAV